MPILQQDARGRRWSVEDVWAIPEDGHRYETVDGELLVSPAPRYGHQAVAMALYAALREWVRARGIGVVLVSPADIILDPYTLVQPDVFVLPPVGQDVMWGKAPAPAPLLAIEVLSPGTARNDKLRKRPRLQRAGIECWLVDPEAQLVERWLPEADRPEVCVTSVRWEPSGSPEGCAIPLAPIWAEAGLPPVE
ncbi:MAG: Uma2 family endonuclease [Gemmatimonadaceae bacterium]|nr:Uma2 family endonuclease [Gemmatimonadaceae bacterium]